MSQVSVCKVENKSDYQAFFDFPWKVYQDSPYWVPPLKSLRRHTLDRKKSAAWEYIEGDYFVAWRGDEPVGTIAALTNHRHNETWKENIGWFGALEFINDAAVVKALFNTAEDYLRQRGHDAIRGPVTFNFNSEIGILMNSYDRTPLILMPYNYPYYPERIEEAGYHKAKDLITWYNNDAGLTTEGGQLPLRLRRVVERLIKRGNIVLRSGSRENIRADFEIIYELYNTAWQDNWGFVPLTPRELDELIKDLKQYYVPEITFFAFVGDKPAGFALSVPDMNQVLHRAYPRPGEPEIWTLLKALWHWKIRPKIDSVRVPLLGVKEEFRHLGIEAALMLSLFQKALELTQYQHYDGGWVLEDNDGFNQVAEHTYSKRDRHYRIYEKSLK